MFGLTRLRIEPESTVSASHALFTRPLIDWYDCEESRMVMQQSSGVAMRGRGCRELGRLNLNFKFESAYELLMNLNSTFAKSMNLNLVF